jgi:hypothetical protein
MVWCLNKYVLVQGKLSLLPYWHSHSHCAGRHHAVAFGSSYCTGVHWNCYRILYLKGHIEFFKSYHSRTRLHRILLWCNHHFYLAWGSSGFLSRPVVFMNRTLLAVLEIHTANNSFLTPPSSLFTCNPVGRSYRIGFWSLSTLSKPGRRWWKQHFSDSWN